MGATSGVGRSQGGHHTHETHTKNPSTDIQSLIKLLQAALQQLQDKKIKTKDEQEKEDLLRKLLNGTITKPELQRLSKILNTNANLLGQASGAGDGTDPHDIT